MIEMYRTPEAGAAPEPVETITDGCWVRMIQPTDAEVAFVCRELSIPREDLTILLDEEESPRMEQQDDGRTLIIVDSPYISMNKNTETYTTIPSGFIVLKNVIVTVSLRKNPILQNFAEGRVKNFSTTRKTRFLLQFLYRNSGLFVQNLRQIDRRTVDLEKNLRRATRNEELFALLNLQKSLVYITTALKANETVLEKLARFPTSEIRMREEDSDLLDDTIIENRQALEMASTYSSTLTSTMDAFASIINNNVNDIMKLFTCVTILLTIPTMAASFLGMNVLIPGLFSENPLAFMGIIFGSLSVSAVLLWIMFRKKII